MHHPDLETTPQLVAKFMAEKTEQGILMPPQRILMRRSFEEFRLSITSRFTPLINAITRQINPYAEELPTFKIDPAYKGYKRIAGSDDEWFFNHLTGFTNSFQIGFSTSNRYYRDLVLMVCAYQPKDKNVPNVFLAPMLNSISTDYPGGELILPDTASEGIYWGCNQPMPTKDLRDQDSSIVYQSIQYASKDTFYIWQKLSQIELPESVKKAINAGLKDFQPQQYK